MNWVLPFDWKPPAERAIKPSDTLFFLGSCFAENMAEKLLADKFTVCTNPFGILYNPVSMAEALQICHTANLFSEQNLFCFNDLWHSEAHHSEFSGADKAEVLDRINARMVWAHKSLLEANYVFLTFGTAKVYVSKQSGKIVGNCHKRPTADFSERYLETEEIVTAWENLFALFPEKVFYVSISPVRYVREGLVESNTGKAVLRVALMRLAERFPNVHYFPAYELVTDVLRDYRFYANDLVHPNQQAIDFVYDFFMEKLFTPLAKDYLKEWRKVAAMLNHKALNPNSPQWKQFEEKRAKALQDFEEKWGRGSF